MSKVMSRPQRRFLVALVCGAAAAAAVFLAPGSKHTSASTKPSAITHVAVHTDHATYSTLGNLTAASEVVVIGTVTSSTAAPPITSPDPAAPAIPQTDFGVEVLRVMKGGLGVGSTITVDVATSSPDVYVESAPTLSIGQTYAFFLVAGGDGKYYALAGDTAIAPLGDDGAYTLPGDATGDESLTFSEADLATVGPADHVAITFKHGDSIVGDVQSGALVVSPSRISGAVVVQGRAIEFDLTIKHHNAIGSFSIDGVSYLTTPGGLPRGGTGVIGTLHGPVRAGKRYQVVEVTVRGH